MSKIADFVQNEGLESRESQVKMAMGVTRALKDGTPAFIEGGTGNGKTFAYLVDLIDYLHNNPTKKAVISTATILLQDQVLKKDLPKVINYFKKKYGNDFSISMSDVAKLVGSRNYVCEDDPMYDDVSSGKINNIKNELGDKNFKKLLSLIKTARKTKSPIMMRDLDFKIPHNIRGEIGCNGINGCKCHEKGYAWRCAYKAVNDASHNARVLITNHNYLTTSFRAVVGREVIVIDEAHKLPDILSKKSSAEFNITAFKGLCDSIINHANAGSIIPEINSALYDAKKTIKPLRDRIATIESAIVDDCKLKKSLTAKLNSLNGIGISKGTEIVSYILRGAIDENNKHNITSASKFRAALYNLKGSVLQFYDNKTDKSAKTAKSSFTIIASLCSSLIRYLEDINSIYTSSGLFKHEAVKDKHGNILKNSAGETIRNAVAIPNVIWFEKGVNRVSIMRAPIDKRYVQQRECYSLFRSKHEQRTPIFVSATLSLSENAPDFSYFKKEIGMNDVKNTIEIKVPSSFDWAKQVKFIIPTDVPQPNYSEDNIDSMSNETMSYYETIAKSICSSLPHIHGNALVLCSSVGMTDYIARYIEKNAGGNVLVMNQADGTSVDRMVNDMRKGIQPQKVLVGMQGLWQGIDLQGESLRGLFIAKLPFQHPTHPLTQARQDEMARTKRSYFFEISVPETTIIARQGVGRLIRGNDPLVEYGTIVVYDPKLSIDDESQKSYIKKMKKDIFPKEMLSNVKRVAVDDVVAEIKEFFDSKSSDLNKSLVDDNAAVMRVD
jgi:ATP-dependent DNA helicase DinG